MNVVEVTIVNKRLINTTDKAYVFTSRGYGGGEVFTIPFSMAVKTIESKIGDDDAVTYTIKRWMFNKLKEVFDGMHSYHIIMLK